MSVGRPGVVPPARRLATRRDASRSPAVPRSPSGSCGCIDRAPHLPPTSLAAASPLRVESLTARTSESGRVGAGRAGAYGRGSGRGGSRARRSRPSARRQAGNGCSVRTIGRLGWAYASTKERPAPPQTAPPSHPPPPARAAGIVAARAAGCQRGRGAPPRRRRRAAAHAPRARACTTSDSGGIADTAPQQTAATATHPEPTPTEADRAPTDARPRPPPPVPTPNSAPDPPPPPRRLNGSPTGYHNTHQPTSPHAPPAPLPPPRPRPTSTRLGWPGPSRVLRRPGLVGFVGSSWQRSRVSAAVERSEPGGRAKRGGGGGLTRRTVWIGAVAPAGEPELSDPTL